MVILCLLAGTTFWVLNALNKSYSTKINYPVTFVIEDTDDVVVVEDLPEKIEIDVSGGGWNLLRKTFWFNINPLNIPLNNPEEVNYILGSSLVPLISDQLSEISLNYVVTDTLQIRIEEKIKKTLKVRLDSPSIEVNPPYQIISEVIVSPDSVTFTGPSSAINDLPDTITLSLPSGIENDYNEDVEINYRGSDLVSYAPEAVNVRFEVARFVRVTKVVDVYPVNFPSDSSFALMTIKSKLSIPFWKMPVEK